jgi:hypothetical protein
MQLPPFCLLNSAIFLAWWMIKQMQIVAKMLGLEIRAKASTVTPNKFLFGGQTNGKRHPSSSVLESLDYTADRV